MKDIGYILYIDEAGDDGIRIVDSNNPASATDWFLFSGVLVRYENRLKTTGWRDSILAALHQNQLKSIHFTKLADHKRKLAVELLSTMNIRCFFAISNKKNMGGYVNPRAARLRSNSFFYCWMARLLLENVTEFCERDSLSRFGRIKKLRIVFSRRGYVSYPQLKAYLYKLRMQSQAARLYIKTKDIRWSVIDIGEIYNRKADDVAGLQLADIAAGAFYQALGEVKANRKPDPSNAMRLRGVIPKSKTGRFIDYSVKLMPKLNQVKLTSKEAEIFRFYSGN